MRKPMLTIAALLVLAAVVYAAARVVTSDGPCTPKEPPPVGAP